MGQVLLSARPRGRTWASASLFGPVRVGVWKSWELEVADADAARRETISTNHGRRPQSPASPRCKTQNSGRTAALPFQIPAHPARSARTSRAAPSHAHAAGAVRPTEHRQA